MADFDIQRVSEVLKEIKPKCPICGCEEYTIGNGFVHHSLSTKLNVLSQFGNHIIAVAIFCNKCGHVDTYASNVLRLTY